MLDSRRQASYDAALACLLASGCEVVEIDLEPFLAAGLLLYQGAFVAERFAAVGDWIDAHRDIVGGHTPHGGFEMDNGYILEKAFLKA